MHDDDDDDDDDGQHRQDSRPLEGASLMCYAAVVTRDSLTEHDSVIMTL